MKELKYPFVIFNQADSKSLQEKLLNDMNMSWSFSSGRSGEGVQNEDITYIYSNWNFDGKLLFETDHLYNDINNPVWSRVWGDNISFTKYIWNGKTLNEFELK